MVLILFFVKLSESSCHVSKSNKNLNIIYSSLSASIGFINEALLAGSHAARVPAITSVMVARTTNCVLTPGSVIKYSFNVSFIESRIKLPAISPKNPEIEVIKIDSKVIKSLIELGGAPRALRMPISFVLSLNQD